MRQMVKRGNIRRGLNLMELIWAILILSGAILGFRFGLIRFGGIGAVVGIVVGIVGGLIVAYALTFVIAILCHFVLGMPWTAEVDRERKPSEDAPPKED